MRRTLLGLAAVAICWVWPACLLAQPARPVVLHVPETYITTWPTAELGQAIGFDCGVGRGLMNGQPNTRDISGVWFGVPTNLSIWQWGFHNSDNLSPTRCQASCDPRWGGWVGRVGFPGCEYADLLASTVTRDERGLWIYAIEVQPGQTRPQWLVDLAAADVNRDGAATVQDIFEFIGLVNTGRTTRSVFEFLAAWFGAAD